MRVLVIPRIAAVITVLTAMILVGGVLVTESAGHRLALLALFPVVILSFAAERLQEIPLHVVAERLQWRDVDDLRTILERTRTGTAEQAIE